MGDLPKAHVEQLDTLASTYWWHVHRIALTTRLLCRFGKSPFARYLDVGCGPGATTARIAAALKARGALAGQVWGVDGDAGVAARCKAHGVNFALADLEEGAPKLLDRFDVFSLLDVLEHVAAPEKLLASLKGTLLPDAVGVISVPAYQWLFSDWDRTFGHHRRYALPELRALLEKSGYRVLWSSYAFSYALAPAAAKRKLCSDKKTDGPVVEFPLVPGWVNAALRGAGACERAWMGGLPVPFGTSAFAVVTPS